jgi:uncharacterized protein (DUF2336 family)
MLVRQFMASFMASGVASSPAQRGPAAADLTGALVRGELNPQEERDAQLILTALLDDPSPLVRGALAQELSVAYNAPHHIVVALANDQAEVAAPILNKSPRLTDADLIDCAAIGDCASQIAIATRLRVSAAVAAAIAEVGAREAVVALIGNDGADTPDFSLARIIERFGEDGETREALLHRGDLPVTLRAKLVDAAANALTRFVVSRDWLSAERAERATREAREKATVLLAADSSDNLDGPGALVRHLREQGQLTAGLVLRALLSGNTSLLIAALAELSGLPARRVAGYVGEFEGAGFGAVFHRAGLPETLLPAYRAALCARKEFGDDPDSQARLSRTIIERVLTSCERADDSALAPVIALLRRFDAEAARDDAREGMERLTRERAPPVERRKGFGNGLFNRRFAIAA